MNVFYEWRKLIICIILFVLLFALQHFTGADFSGPIGSLIDYALVLLGIGALKNSILSTTERKTLRSKINDSSKPKILSDESS